MPYIVPLLGSPALVTGIDAGNEAWSVSIYGKVLTAANLVAQEGFFATWVDSVMAIELGAKKTTYYGNEIHFAFTQPSNGAAREIALRVTAKDITTQMKFSYRIPAIDPTIPAYVTNPDAKDAIEIDTPASISDLVAAFNAFAVSPITGNALNVYSLRVVRGGK